MIDTNTEMLIDEKLNRIAKVVERAIYESEIAIDDPDKGYPYSSGYCTSALKEVLDNVKQLQTCLK